jgi:hypothetical protein
MSFLYAVRSYHCDKIHFVRCYTFKKQGCNIEHIKKNNTPAMCIPPPPPQPERLVMRKDEAVGVCGA